MNYCMYFCKASMDYIANIACTYLVPKASLMASETSTAKINWIFLFFSAKKAAKQQ